MKVVALIQCTADDIGRSTDANDYAVGLCLRTALFESVALACPDQPASTMLEELAHRWGVACYRGDEFNVGRRLLAAARAEGADIVVRVLLRQFYLDVEQVRRMATALQASGSAYVALPSDYNYALAADVCTTGALACAVDEIDTLENELDRASFAFSPWVYMERHPEHYPVVAIDGGPPYPQERSQAIRDRYRRLLSENQAHFAWNFPASSYRFLGAYLHADWRVMDIACGKGQGVRCLKDYCAAVVGVDLDEDNIAQARSGLDTSTGISFHRGNAETYVEVAAYDAIVSLHTLEHLVHPEAFFERARQNLRTGGALFLEVPLLLPHPLGIPLVPWHEKEYLLPELVAQVRAAGFLIDEVWVKQRHAFIQLPTNSDAAYQDLPPKVTAGLILAHKAVEV